MKNVKTILMFVVISTLVFAGSVRTGTLGGAKYWADDYSNISAFPNDLSDHAGTAYTDGNGFTSIFNHNGATWAVSANDEVHDVVNVGWDSGDLGVSFTLNMQDGEDTNFDIGVGMPLAGGNFGFRTDTKDHSVSLRRDQSLWIWDTMVAGLNMYETASDATGGNKMAFNADFYSNNGTLLHALGFAYGDQDSGDASLDMSTTFGVESAWTDWATVRLGYSKSYDLMNQAGNDDGSFKMGIGFNYGGFTLDMTLNTNILTDPVVFMTGNNSNGGGAGNTLGTLWEISYNW